MDRESKLLVTGGSGFIGTNLIADALSAGIAVVNFDTQPPLDPAHAQHWMSADVMQPDALRGAFADFAPTHVIHLAARTDCDEQTTVDDYRVNIEGTSNVLTAVAAAPSVERAIITSTQFVCGPGFNPAGDADYRPHTVYGRSKALMEDLTRAANLPCTWTIIRPVNIWGPWHIRYRREFLKVMRRGLYLHPGRSPVIRTYGYIGNVVWQIRRIFDAPAADVHQQTLYVGDRPIDIHDWVNGFSQRMHGRPVRVVPRSLIKALGNLGDAIVRVGGRFPITSSRYKSMTSEYLTPMDRTFALLGEPPFSMDDGIESTLAWLTRWPEPAANERP